MNKYFLILIIIVSCSNSHNLEKTDSKEILEQKACEICLLNDKIYQFDNVMVGAMLDGKTKEEIDSLKNVQSQLQEEYDLKLEKFKIEGNYKSIFFAKDSAKAICMRRIVFGVALPKTRRREIIDTLANEILGMRSGFMIPSKKYLLKSSPKINEKGEMFVRDRMNPKTIIIVNDYEEWRANEINEYDEWMKKIDNLLLELHGKRYDEFDEIEKIILEYNLYAVLNEQK